MTYRKPSDNELVDSDAAKLEQLVASGQRVLNKREQLRKAAEIRAERYRAAARNAARKAEIRRLANVRWHIRPLAVIFLTFPLIVASGVGLHFSPLYFAVWVHLLIWFVVPAAIGVGVGVAWLLCNRLGRRVFVEEQERAEGYPVKLTNYPEVLLQVHGSDREVDATFEFPSGAPTAQQLKAVLTAIDSAVRVSFDDDRDGFFGRRFDSSDEVAATVTYEVELKHSSKLVYAWLPGWLEQARAALETLHRVHPLGQISWE